MRSCRSLPLESPLACLMGQYPLRRLSPPKTVFDRLYLAAQRTRIDLPHSTTALSVLLQLSQSTTRVFGQPLIKVQRSGKQVASANSGFVNVVSRVPPAV